MILVGETTPSSLLPQARAMVPFLIITEQTGLAATVLRFITNLEALDTPQPPAEVARAAETLAMCARQIDTWGTA